MPVFSNAYLRHVTMGWICLSSVCEASRPMMGKRRQLARLPNVLLLFVQRNSRKCGPWNYSLTCCPVLTQLLESLLNRYSALSLAHVCACVTGLQHSTLYRFRRFAQLLVPKTTRENSERSSALNTPTASANAGPSPSLRQCC